MKKEWTEEEFRRELIKQAPDDVRISHMGFQIDHTCSVCDKTIIAYKKYYVLWREKPEKWKQNYVACSKKCANFSIFQHLWDDK